MTNSPLAKSEFSLQERLNFRESSYNNTLASLPVISVTYSNVHEMRTKAPIRAAASSAPAYCVLGRRRRGARPASAADRSAGAGRCGPWRRRRRRPWWAGPAGSCRPGSVVGTDRMRPGAPLLLRARAAPRTTTADLMNEQALQGGLGETVR